MSLDAVVAYIRRQADQQRMRAHHVRDDAIGFEMERYADSWDQIAAALERGEHLEDAA